MKRQIVMMLGLSAALIVHAGEEVSIEMSDIPEPVMQAISERFEQIELLSANTETELDGFTVFEVQGTIPAGEFLPGEYSPLTDDDGEIVTEQISAPDTARQVEFDVTPDGQFDEIEIQFSDHMVPGAVMQAVARAYPDFVPDFIEASYSETMDVIGYEFSGLQQDKPLDIEVSPSGRHIQEADL